jgi:hypothetical protein
MTQNSPRQWVCVDLGRDLRLELQQYTVSHWRGGPGNSLRNWELQGSDDGRTWTPLRKHSADSSLTARCSTVTFKVPRPAPPQPKSFRMFRIFMTGPNSLNNDILVCSGLELYGLLEINDSLPQYSFSNTE